ncbi:EAL domain-containing protein [Altererythrobacter xixiisoli]|uniref:EAL domain-containing protein n=1 Tax=Croceibacterium xixiisoli TaxID=1476466 RepID=A0A6I4TXR6_9SPHN|nr:EAL domain-containing protein [Croceibacterium xixiisoli]MXP00795.1 EAL domain-containing protein [Croceibacterium xixiisoli]
MDLSHVPLSSSDGAERVGTLFDPRILQSTIDPEFDNITRLAAAVLGTEGAAISLIDKGRQRFKSVHGIAILPAFGTFVSRHHTVTPGETVVVSDALLDPRFGNTPLVTAGRGIRFYASAPLTLKSGQCIGTFCVFDRATRDGSEDAPRSILTDFARVATDLIESRHARRADEIAARVVETMSDAVVAADRQGRIVYWNCAAEKMFGRTQEDAVGEDIGIIIPERLAVSHADLFSHAFLRSDMHPFELAGVRANGQEFPAELSLAPWGTTLPHVGFAAIIRDISKRIALKRQRESAKNFLDTVVRNLPAMLFVKDAETREYIWINRAGEQVIGLPADKIIGRTDRELFRDYGAAYEQRDTDAIASPDDVRFESEFVRDDGEVMHLRTTRTMIDGPDQPRQYILGISEDVTATRLAESKVRRLAHYDTLTGVLNRSSFNEKLRRLVEREAKFALLSVDLDRFKAVNDQLGHTGGDTVLAAVADRLVDAVGDAGWIARVGGDEFVAVLTCERLRECAQEIAHAITISLAKRFTTDKGVAHLGASVGIVLSPEDGSSASELRENVDLALYRAKQQGKGNACFFNSEIEAAADDRRKLEKDLRAAIKAGDITLAYQPVVMANTGKITSLEALARWTAPVRGQVPPDIFIPLAEECGLIDQLGEQLLRMACIYASTLPDSICVAVNLSPLQFLPGNLVETVREAVEIAGIRPDRLQVEVTEGLVIRDVDRTFYQLAELRELGVKILMDDFGVGYSSLSYFQRFPFDKVKLDKSFIEAIEVSAAAQGIVQAVIGLGKALDMGIVAEGVETPEQRDILVEAGCTHLQGYLFGCAMTPEEIRRLLTDPINTDLRTGSLFSFYGNIS